MKNQYKMLLLLAVVLLVFTGCKLTKQQRVDNKVVKKLDKLKGQYPESFKKATTETVRIDTVLQEVVIEGETKIDTVEVEKFLTEYLHDTVEINRFLPRFIAIAKDTVEIDTLAIHLWIEGVGVKYKLKKDEQHIEASKQVNTLTVTETVVVKKIPWWVWLIIIALSITTLLAILKR